MTSSSPSSSSSSNSKFRVYQNPSLPAVLTSKSLQPSNYTLISVLSFFFAFAFAFLTIVFRENEFIDILRLQNLSPFTAYCVAKTLQTLVGVIFSGTLSALFKVIYLHKTRYGGGGGVAVMHVRNSNNVNTNEMSLTKHQLDLLGVKPNVDLVKSDSSKKTPKSKSRDLLVPLHPPIPGPSRCSWDAMAHLISTSSRSPGMESSSLLLSHGVISPPQSSSGMNLVVSSPWSNRRASYGKKITSEKMLEHLLAEVDERIIESAWKMYTPPYTVPAFGRETPLRLVRMYNSRSNLYRRY